MEEEELLTPEVEITLDPTQTDLGLPQETDHLL